MRRRRRRGVGVSITPHPVTCYRIALSPCISRAYCCNRILLQNCYRIDFVTELEYCHPYSSWERGQNENQNALIRRFIPKGTRIENYTDDQIRAVQDWLNTMPRKKFNWQTSLQLFENALSKIGISPDEVFL